MRNVFLSTLILIISNFANAEIVLPEVDISMREKAKQSITNARKQAISIKKPIINKAMLKDVGDLVNASKNKEKSQKKTVQNLINNTVNNSVWKQNQAKMLSTIGSKFGIETKDIDKQLSGSRLYFFISSSMPKDKVRKYVKKLSKYPQSQILLRGFIGGGKKMRPTMNYIKSIIAKNENCQTYKCPNHKVVVNIDPVLFERYGVDKVPALVGVDNISGDGYCSEGNTDVVSVSGVNKFVGLAPISYMLRELGIDNE
jgi:type-F conjugative transfer system pilin assembly protein TrbC